MYLENSLEVSCPKARTPLSSVPDSFTPVPRRLCPHRCSFPTPPAPSTKNWTTTTSHDPRPPLLSCSSLFDYRDLALPWCPSGGSPLLPVRTKVRLPSRHYLCLRKVTQSPGQIKSAHSVSVLNPSHCRPRPLHRPRGSPFFPGVDTPHRPRRPVCVSSSPSFRSTPPRGPWGSSHLIEEGHTKVTFPPPSSSIRGPCSVPTLERSVLVSPSPCGPSVPSDTLSLIFLSESSGLHCSPLPVPARPSLVFCPSRSSVPQSPSGLLTTLGSHPLDFSTRCQSFTVRVSPLEVPTCCSRSSLWYLRPPTPTPICFSYLSVPRSPVHSLRGYRRDCPGGCCDE